VLTEQPLSADGGVLYGRADLVIRGKERHQIIDYKSGAVVERDTQLPRAAYVRQLQLYAYLEHASSGSWPSTAHLFPLHGAPVEISVEPAECTSAASDALTALHDYNAAVGAPQPARPSPEHCKWCAAAPVCDAFWQACDQTWSPSVCAVSGTVTSAFGTDLGGTTIHVDQRAGSLSGDGSIVIKNIDSGVLGDRVLLAPGDEVAATGLVPDGRGTGYWLRAAGALAVRRRMTT
jgi:PD-(D/E)XK nuclease superfamily